MRVLYVTAYPTALSETYIRTEIEWMQRQGVDVVMLAREEHPAPHPNTVPADKIMIGERLLGRAIERFRPDIVHAHWVVALHGQLNALARAGVPATVRGHAFEVTPDMMEPLLAADAVKRVWLFPHFASDYPHAKVAPLTSCYDSSLFTPGDARRPRRVLRIAAGVTSKRLETMLAIAARCPEVPFTIATTRAYEASYPDLLRLAAPDNVEMRVNITRDEARTLMHESSIYLTTLPNHRFGMPVAVVEAMGSGMFPLLPDVRGAREYIGAAGAVYEPTVDEAAARVRAAVAWSEETWAAAHAVSVAEAQRFRADAVLPAVLAEWCRLSGR